MIMNSPPSSARLCSKLSLFLGRHIVRLLLRPFCFGLPGTFREIPIECLCIVYVPVNSLAKIAEIPVFHGSHPPDHLLFYTYIVAQRKSYNGYRKSMPPLIGGFLFVL